MFNMINILYLFYTIITVVEYRSSRSEDAFQELNRKSTSLKRILSRIPDEITDRKTFLETIKYISMLMYIVVKIVLFISYSMLF